MNPDISLVQRLLALLGLASKEVQAQFPPLLAYIGLMAGAYFSAEVVEAISGVLGRFAVYLRIPGVLGVAFVGHMTYRAVIHGDPEKSWLGGILWILKR